MSRNKVGWEDLPTEIKISIVSHVRDLGSLGALLHASPFAFRQFGPDARALAETILASHTGGHTAVLVWLCALLRAGTLPFRDNATFLRCVTLEALTPALRIRPSSWGGAPRGLPADCDPAIVRGLLSVARHVTRVAGECLHTMRDRFAAPAAPEGPPRWGGGQRVKRDPRLAFTWEEEQRVVRALWRVQLIY